MRKGDRGGQDPSRTIEPEFVWITQYGLPQNNSGKLFKPKEISSNFPGNVTSSQRIQIEIFLQALY